MRIELGADRWNIYFTNSSGQEELFMFPLEIRDCSVVDEVVMRQITKELLEQVLQNDANAEQLIRGTMGAMGLT